MGFDPKYFRRLIVSVPRQLAERTAASLRANPVQDVSWEWELTALLESRGIRDLTYAYRLPPLRPPKPEICALMSTRASHADLP